MVVVLFTLFANFALHCLVVTIGAGAVTKQRSRNDAIFDNHPGSIVGVRSKPATVAAVPVISTGEENFVLRVLDDLNSWLNHHEWRWSYKGNARRWYRSGRTWH